MKRALEAVALVALVALPARANVWQQAITSPDDASDDDYAAAMDAGDDSVEQATAHDIGAAAGKNSIDDAIAHYQAAAKIKPNEAEPWFRIGGILRAYYLECDPNMQMLSSCRPAFTKERAETAIAAWNEAERLAPLDPRFTVMLGEAGVLFERAIQHTKLVTPEHLAAAARDYEKILARSSVATPPDDAVIGNLAETYMMLDRLDEAIDAYRQVQRIGGTASTSYGLAVALDRDEQGLAAFDEIHRLGETSVADFHQSTQRGATFFVPEGEVYYYYALLAEAYDHDAEALNDWRLYISSNAHPEYQPRARQHIAALLAHHPSRTPPGERDMDPREP